jgi:2-polyprenyl-3-methyl-5-hydroxy-6-metoxy-1,4-benzoquinol methylase
MATRCVVCGEPAASVVGRRLVRRGTTETPLELRRCATCSTVYASTWEAEFPAELYDYYRQLEGKPRAELYDPINESRYDTLLEELGRLVSGRRLLDVGCGIGQWVDAASRRGWDASGIELAEGAVRVAQSVGARVERLPLESELLDRGAYDVVTMFEVIEHVPAPRAFLRRAAELLRPGGVLLMTTPNFRSIDRLAAGDEWGVIHPEHYSYFTPTTARALVQSTALLTVLRLQTQNVSPSLLVQRLRRGPGARDRGGAEVAASPVATDQALRGTIERSLPLRLAKGAVNRLLDAAGIGSAMTVWCRRME